MVASLAGALRANEFGQASADSYTRYELLDPASSSFRILYDVTATTPGNLYYFNPIRPGSTPTVHAVTDLFSGEALPWRLVEHQAARTRGWTEAEEGMRYIEVTLARPVPADGEARIRIDKTYRDAKSYRVEGDRLVFERELGIARNAIVLPAGWELVRSDFPSQINTEPDGRLRISFRNRNPGAAQVRIEARQLPVVVSEQGPNSADVGPITDLEVRPARPQETATGARLAWSFDERAFQDREIVYFLQQPETHAFRLYHDYTEKRPGVDRYVNVVRPGSRASGPSAKLLDTGETLRVETLRGDQIKARNIEIGEAVNAHTEIVVIWFPAVAAGHSSRLRIEETYTDPGRYGLENGHLLWDRSFGRASNVVVLPPGWLLEASSMPAVVDLDEEGLVRLRFENDRPDDLEVYLRAGRRAGGFVEP